MWYYPLSVFKPAPKPTLPLDKKLPKPTHPSPKAPKKYNEYSDNLNMNKILLPKLKPPLLPLFPLPVRSPPPPKWNYKPENF